MTVQTAQFVLSVVVDDAGHTRSKAATIEQIMEGADPKDRLLVQRGSQRFGLDWGRVQQNLNVILDDDLFVCTDTDGVTYKVTGAQFKSAVDELLPEDSYEPNGILILESGSLKVQGGLYSGTTGAIGRPDSVTENVGTSFTKTYTIPGEYEFPMANMQRLSFYGSTTAAFNFKLGFDVSNVQNISKMFQCCYLFDGDISRWDTSNATNMMYMFNNARAFNQEIGGWDTSKVPSMAFTFNNAHAFNCDISGWNTANVTNFSSFMTNASVFNQQMQNFDTSSAVNMYAMFRYCRQFNQPLSSWKVSECTNMAYMFNYAEQFDQDISYWCVTKIRSKPSNFDTSSAFQNKTAIQPSWGKCAPQPIDGATPVIGIVGGSSAVAEYGDILEILENGAVAGYSTPYLNQWQRETAVGSGEFRDIEGETNATYEVKSLDQNRYIRLAQTFGDPAVGSTTLYSNRILGTDAAQPFPHAIGVVFAGPGTMKVNITKTTAGQAFRYEDETYFPIAAGTSTFTQSTPGFYLFESVDITAFNFSGTSSTAVLELDVRSRMESITDASRCFYNLRKFDQDLSWWDVSNVTNMSNMFNNCYEFNGNISGWDVTNVTNVVGMFNNAQVFNQELSGWTLTSSSYQQMFQRAYKFNGVFNPTFGPDADLSNMFAFANSYNVDISGWDVSTVQNMRSLFQGASKFNQDLSPWEVQNTNNMAYMFQSASTFNYDISYWCVPLIPSLPASFANSCPLPAEFYPQWGKCPSRPVSDPIIV